MPDVKSGKRREAELHEEAASMKRDLYMIPWVGPSDEIMMIDPLLQLSGTDRFSDIYDVYREMLLKWPHFRHCINKRKNAILSKNLTITPANGDERSREIAEFTVHAIQGITEFRDDLRELLDAICYGFSVSELIWGIRTAKKMRGLVIERIMSRDQRRFRFSWKNELMLDQTGTRVTFAKAPQDKFVVHSYNKEFEIPYGWGEARYAYWYYFFAKNGLKFWSLFTEKYASPTVVGKHPPGINKAEQDALLHALTALQNDQAIRIPDNIVVELLEAQRSGSLDCYQNFIRYLENSISKAILGGTLTSDEGIHGTRAQAEVHEEGRLEFTRSDCESLAGTIKSQIIAPLVRYNYGDEDLPNCTFDDEKQENLLVRAQTDEILVKLGVPLSRKYFYETYKRTAPTENDETVEREPEAENKAGVGLFAEDRSPDIGNRWREEEERYITTATDRGKKFYHNAMTEIRRMFESADDESGVWAIRPEMFEVDITPLANYLSWIIYTGMLNGMAQVERLPIKMEFAERDKFVFAPLPPEDAIEWFSGLLPMTREEYDYLLRQARQTAFTVADIQSRDTISKVQDSLTKTLSEGGTFAQWKAGIRDVFESAGVGDKSEFRMQTVFQTNIHNALVEGRDRMMANLAQEGVLKLGRWQSVGDSRVRDEHAALDGRVFAWDDSIWSKLKDYNCRCMKIPVVE